MKQINDIAGEPVLDFIVISDRERRNASRNMLYLLASWAKDTDFFQRYRINSQADSIDKEFEYYWFLYEKIERDLADKLKQEKLGVQIGGDFITFKEIGHTYMALLANEMREQRDLPLVTNDELSIIPKLNSGLSISDGHYDGFQLVSLAVPEVYLKPLDLKRLSFSEILSIRKDTLPLANAYHNEIASYQKRINTLSIQGNEEEAFKLFQELCSRVALSFKPFAKECTKIFEVLSDSTKLTLATGIALPAIGLLTENDVLKKYCDISSISATATNYYVKSQNIKMGFDFLATLNRNIRHRLLLNRLNVLVPKILK
jgi:hypothetical protein